MDSISCAPIPTRNEGEQPQYIVNNMPMVVWKNSKHPEICKAFIESFYEPETYVPFLHSVPVGMLPALKEITMIRRSFRIRRFRSMKPKCV